jgi:hypothetical protein
LVQGRTNCAGLTSGEVTARKLAEVLQPGYERRRIPGLAWSDFLGNCLIILSSQAESSTNKIAVSTEATTTTEAAATATEAAITTTEAATITVATSGQISTVGEASARDARSENDSWRSGRAASGRILRLVPTARFFTSINLASFTVISAGFSSK